MAKLELFYPIKNPFFVTQKFGDNLVPLYKQLGMLGHNGWDAIGEIGQPIYAAHDGIVTFAGEDGSGGLGIVVRTLDKFEYQGGESYFKSIYWHCKTGSFAVKAGEIVKVGQKLAECDTTGLAQGSHLHFGLKPLAQGEQEWQWTNLEQNNGYLGAIDPAPYWNGYFAVDAPQVLGIMRAMIELLKKVVNLLISAKK